MVEGQIRAGSPVFLRSLQNNYSIHQKHHFLHHRPILKRMKERKKNGISQDFAYVHFIPRMKALSNSTLDNWLKLRHRRRCRWWWWLSDIKLRSGGISFLRSVLALPRLPPRPPLPPLSLRLRFPVVTEPQMSFCQNRLKINLSYCCCILFFCNLAGSVSRKQEVQNQYRSGAADFRINVLRELEKNGTANLISNHRL